jgi:hypothetical protein
MVHGIIKEVRVYEVNNRAIQKREGIFNENST